MKLKRKYNNVLISLSLSLSYSSVPNPCHLRYLIFENFPNLPNLDRTPPYWFLPKNFSKHVPNRGSEQIFCLLAIFLFCLHSHDQRCRIYEHRVLHSSIILDLWNYLPNEIKSQASVCTFKKCIKSWSGGDCNCKICK